MIQRPMCWGLWLYLVHNTVGLHVEEALLRLCSDFGLQIDFLTWPKNPTCLEANCTACVCRRRTALNFFFRGLRVVRFGLTQGQLFSPEDRDPFYCERFISHGRYWKRRNVCGQCSSTWHKIKSYVPIFS